MALTKVSPSLFQVSNNITSVTVGGSANTISLTFDSNGVITGASNNALSVANTLITGNIVSSQITSVANTQLTGVITDTQLASTLNLSSKTLTLPSSSVREYQQVSASTTTDRTLVGDSGWVDHLSVTFTANQSCTVLCFANFAHAREDGSVNTGARFILDDSATTDEMQIFKQGFGASYAFGAHSSYGFFNNVSAGSHTIKLQARNSSSGSTGILNHWGQPGGTNHGDIITILYK